MMPTTLQKAVDAYGGEPLWRNAKYVEATLDTQGLAFFMKRRPTHQGIQLRVAVQHPYARKNPIGLRPNVAGVLDGADVHLEDATGQIIEERKNAREHFAHLRQRLWWDDLDMAYFANYAMWNYLVLPALLLREDIQWQETKPGTLKAVFPDNLPTHCRDQEFHFDLETGLLNQHNYTADVISRIAQASNRVTEHRQNKDGVMFASERLVTPRLASGKALNWPTLIALSIRDFRVISD